LAANRHRLQRFLQRLLWVLPHVSENLQIVRFLPGGLGHRPLGDATLAGDDESCRNKPLPVE